MIVEGGRKAKGKKGKKSQRAKKREGCFLDPFFCLYLFSFPLFVPLCIFFSFSFSPRGEWVFEYFFFFWILFEGGERGGCARSEEKGRAASLPTWHGMCHSGRKGWGELHLFRPGM